MGMFIGIGVLVVVVVILIGLYNGLVQLKIRADSAWSDIDVQLKRRNDLIPNLVETVKGYAAHEKSTFENIAKWRSAAMSATAPAERAQCGGAIGAACTVAPVKAAISSSVRPRDCLRKTGSPMPLESDPFRLNQGRP